MWFVWYNFGTDRLYVVNQHLTKNVRDGQTGLASRDDILHRKKTACGENKECTSRGSLSKSVRASEFFFVVEVLMQCVQIATASWVSKAVSINFNHQNGMDSSTYLCHFR